MDFHNAPETYVFYTEEACSVIADTLKNSYVRDGAGERMHLHVEPGMMHCYASAPVFQESRRDFGKQIIDKNGPSLFTDAAAGVDDQIVNQRFRCVRYQVFGTVKRQRNDFQIITEQLPVRIFLLRLLSALEILAESSECEVSLSPLLKIWLPYFLRDSKKIESHSNVFIIAPVIRYHKEEALP